MQDLLRMVFSQILAQLVLISIDEDVRIAEILLCAKAQNWF